MKDYQVVAVLFAGYWLWLRSTDGTGGFSFFWGDSPDADQKAPVVTEEFVETETRNASSWVPDAEYTML